MTTLDMALQIVAALVLENGKRWGDVAEPFQRDDMRAVPDPNSPRPTAS
jgi:hypothetical protein